MKEWTTVDKSGWNYGQDEPDKVHYKEDGFDCLIVRNASGALCGYVGVPENHPWYGKDYQQIDVNVHGGVTFSSGCQHSPDESKGICHVPEPGESDNIWWIGFDCSHALDLCPAFKEYIVYGDQSYRDISYVKSEITHLVKQVTDLLTDREA